MGRAYFGVGFLSETEDINEANVINHVNKHFPPVFISDGNFGSFGDQAEDLHEKLDKLGVENEYNTYSIGDAVLTHEFNYLNTKYAVDNNTKMVNFVNRYVNR
jgi:acetyl esterase/lipase